MLQGETPLDLALSKRATWIVQRLRAAKQASNPTGFITRITSDKVKGKTSRKTDHLFSCNLTLDVLQDYARFCVPLE